MSASSLRRRLRHERMSAFLRGFLRGAEIGIVVGVLALGMLALILLLGTCARAASAEPDVLGSEMSRTLEYESQDHRPQGDGCIIWSIEEDCVPIPEAMQRKVVRVIQCESEWDVAKVGALGERGLLQLHPIHAEAMAREGLDYENEGDRLIWARALYVWHGWTPWRWCGR